MPSFTATRNLLQDRDRRCRGQCPRVTTGHRDRCREGSGQNPTSLRIKTLNTPRLGRTCLDTTKTTREEPTADGILNGETPSTLPLTSGRRRGRPVSPLSRTLVPGRGAGRSTGRGGRRRHVCVSSVSAKLGGRTSAPIAVLQPKNLEPRVLLRCLTCSEADRQTGRETDGCWFYRPPSRYGRSG